MKSFISFPLSLIVVFIKYENTLIKIKLDSL